MQKNEPHIDRKLKERLDMLPDLDLDYRRSKEEVWAGLSRSVEVSAAESPGPVFTMVSGRLWMAAAAILVVLLGTALFMHLYTTGVKAPYGEHVVAQLPDGSQVKLNAGSSISYKPYWWRFNREVQLEGEAFFDVEAGQQFEVNSRAGQTIVLGTRFNVYARHHQYQVTCFSGKVRVVAQQSGHALDIIPNEQATLTREGSLRLSKMENVEEAASWLDNMFVFTGTPLHNVFEEVERQYNVSIIYQGNLHHLYTGNFSRNQPVEQVLKMVCKPYGLEFRKTDQGYEIVKMQ